MEPKCCKCVEYHWPDPQQYVWKDPADGKAYCAMHAPREHKLKPDGSEHYSQSEFNEHIHRYVEKSLTNRKYCSLVGAIFPYDISFERYNEDNPIREISFVFCEFYGYADFNFCKIIKKVNFLFAKFFGEVNFYRCIFMKCADFVKTEFHRKADFIFCDSGAKVLRFAGIETCYMENVGFRPTELKSIMFEGCVMPQRLGVDVHGASNKINLIASESLYRAMKQRALEEHDQQQASHWHFREKLIKLKQLLSCEDSNSMLEIVEDKTAKLSTRAKAWVQLLWHRPHWPKITLTGLYWACSGFGERAVRAGVCLGILVVLSFLANITPQFWDWSALPGSAAANATMATIPFAKDIPGDGWVKVGRGFWQFLIAVQFTLFALAVRNRFRR